MAFSFPFFSARRALGWTVVDAQGGLRGVTVDTAGPKPRVCMHAQRTSTAEPTSADWQALASELGAFKFPVLALLSRSEYQIFLVDKATVRPEEMLQSLRWTLSTLLDYPPEEANLAWMAVPSKTATTTPATPATPAATGSPAHPGKVHVVAARTRLVDQRMRACQQAHLRLSVVDIRQTSQANLAQGLETPASGVCLIYADPLGLQITISFQGDLYLERFIRESLFEAGDTAAEARALKFDRIALEVQRSLDFVRRNFPALQVNLLYVAPTQTEMGLRDELGQRMLLPWLALDLSHLFDWPEGSELVKPEVQALYFNALGASLRSRV